MPNHWGDWCKGDPTPQTEWFRHHPQCGCATCLVERPKAEAAKLEAVELSRAAMAKFLAEHRAAREEEKLRCEQERLAKIEAWKDDMRWKQLGRRIQETISADKQAEEHATFASGVDIEVSVAKLRAKLKNPCGLRDCCMPADICGHNKGSA